MERYTTLWKVPQNLYAENSPVVICAGALLKDNETDRVLAQLKFKNICDYKIKAIKVLITPYDVTGNELPEKQEYQYLDLDESYDCEFGSKNAIYLQNKNTRKFTVNCLQILLWNTKNQKTETWHNNSSYTNVTNENQILKKITDKYFFDKFIGKIDFNNFWDKHVTEENLIYSELADLKDLKLKSNIVSERIKQLNDILIADRRNCNSLSEAEVNILNDKTKIWELINSEKKRKKKHRNHSIAILSVITLLIVVALVFVITRIIIPSKQYDNAITLMANEEYDEALALFSGLDDYKDSPIKKAYCKYYKIRLVESESITKAYHSYTSLLSDCNNLNLSESDISSELLKNIESRIELIEKYTLYIGSYVNTEDDFYSYDIDFKIDADDDDVKIIATRKLDGCRYETDDYYLYRLTTLDRLTNGYDFKFHNGEYTYYISENKLVETYNNKIRNVYTKE